MSLQPLLRETVTTAIAQMSLLVAVGRPPPQVLSIHVRIHRHPIGFLLTTVFASVRRRAPMNLVHVTLHREDLNASVLAN